MKILSVKQPWADCILKYGQDVINQGYQTKYRGELLIYVPLSKITKKEFRQARYLSDFKIPDFCLFTTGVILGKVNLIGVTTDSNSKWAIPGKYHWIVGNPVLFPDPIEYFTNQRFGFPEKELMKTIKTVLKNKSNYKQLNLFKHY